MLYTGDFNEIVSIAIMVIFYSFTYLHLVRELNIDKRTNLFVVVAISLRIILTITDGYFTYLPHSGSDSVTFELHAARLLDGTFTLGTYTFDNYPKFIYLVYSLIGRKPLVIRTINGCLSMFTGGLVFKSIYLLTQNRERASLGMVIFLLFPQSLIFSSIILRESLIVSLATLSVYLFIKYTQQFRIRDLLFSFAAVMLASTLHAGIIFIAVPYLYYLIKDKHKDLSQKFKRRVLIVFSVGLVIVVISFPNVFLRKFEFLTSPNELFTRLNRGNVYGVEANIGSHYLASFRVHSFRDLMIYAPLKIFYFLFSPMPWDIRGLPDAIAFLFDSLFYIVIVPKIFKDLLNLGSNRKDKLIFRTLLFSFILVTGVHAMGTIASGTAVRHRYKGLSLLIILWMILEEEKGGHLCEDIVRTDG